MVYAGLLKERLHIAAEFRELSRVESSIVVFKDHVNVRVLVLVTGDGTVLAVFRYRPLPWGRLRYRR